MLKCHSQNCATSENAAQMALSEVFISSNQEHGRYCSVAGTAGVHTCDNNYRRVPDKQLVHSTILLGPDIQHGVRVERNIQLQAIQQMLLILNFRIRATPLLFTDLF